MRVITSEDDGKKELQKDEVEALENVFQERQDVVNRSGIFTEMKEEITSSTTHLSLSLSFPSTFSLLGVPFSEF